MTFCYNCGEEIEFINNGSGPIPIHMSGGSCSGRGGGGGGQPIRSTSSGKMFVFPFIAYPSYINPNARCPVCGASVYFYQSPYGGRVFFDELGPPWPKHPCTDNTDIWRRFSSAGGRSGYLVGAANQSLECDPETGERNQPTTAVTLVTDAVPPRLAAWVEAGWMPFVVTRIVPRLIGIEAEGKLFVSGEGDGLSFRIVQASADARFCRTQGNLRIGFSLLQNTNPILSILNECPILLKQDPHLQHLTLSSFILTRDGEVEEITLSVLGSEYNE